MPTDAQPQRRRHPSGRASIPVVGCCAPAVPAPERDRIAALAAKLRRDAPALGRADMFGPLVSAGLGEGPAALIGDQREIGLHDLKPQQSFEHRIAFLADEGDILLLERGNPDFERYIRDLLGVDRLQVIALGPPPPGRRAPVASRCSESAALLAPLVAAARSAGRFQIIPHIGVGAAWRLAATLAAEAGVPVKVAAPPPGLARRANDKIWFANRVRDVLGRDALPPTFAAFAPAAVAARIARIARNAERIVVKTPDSAGSMGNIALDAVWVRDLDLARIRALVLSLLRARGWRGRFPLLVGVWEAEVAASPSVQLWIPPAGRSDPIVEGVFEQRVAGLGAEFVGAAPARLPEPTIDRIAGEAVRLALLLQALGYFGRCSFDCLLTGRPGAEAVRWVECNARWGGVSIPMTFANRILGDFAAGGMVIVQDMALPLSVAGVQQAFVRLDDLLLRRGGVEGIAPMSIDGFERGAGIQFLSVARTQARAEARAMSVLARMTGAV